MLRKVEKLGRPQHLCFYRRVPYSEWFSWGWEAKWPQNNPGVCPTQRQKLAAERSATGKTQQFDWGGKPTSPSAQLLAGRRVKAAHLVWQRSSKSGGLKESDKLKEQLNYEAWMPRRGKRQNMLFFLLFPVSTFLVRTKRTVMGDPRDTRLKTELLLVRFIENLFYLKAKKILKSILTSLIPRESSAFGQEMLSLY